MIEKKRECRNRYRSIEFGTRGYPITQHYARVRLLQTMYIDNVSINTYLYLRLKAVTILMIDYCNIMPHVFTYEDRCTSYVCICT